jgi:hypothetical protein
MTKGNRLIMPMKLGSDFSAFMTICFLNATSYRNDKVTSLAWFPLFQS